MAVLYVDGTLQPRHVDRLPLRLTVLIVHHFNLSTTLIVVEHSDGPIAPCQVLEVWRVPLLKWHNDSIVLFEDVIVNKQLTDTLEQQG